MSQPASRESRPTRVVYIVDDDEAVRDSTSLLLKSEGFAALEFPSADAFLEHFDPVKSGCILLDLHMPGMSGLELLELMKARGIETPVIVISGRRDPALNELVMRAGAMAILSKPSKDDDLLSLVSRAFEAR